MTSNKGRNNHCKKLTVWLWGFMVLFLAGLLFIPTVAYAFESPEGYDDYEYQKIVQFLELSDGLRKNGKKLGIYYDPTDPETWRGIIWTEDENSDKKVEEIKVSSKDLIGRLDVSNFESLTSIECYSNKLTGLDASNCEALENLLCYDNELTELYVDGCTNLETFTCYDNDLTHLDPSSCESLVIFSCQRNELTGCMDLTGLEFLTHLKCYENRLDGLILDGCTALLELQCKINEITELSVSDCTELEVLVCSENMIGGDLDLADYKDLLYVYCNDNLLTGLKVDGCSKLIELQCHENKLTELDVSDNTSLHVFYCYDNQITGDMDLSNYKDLQSFHCSFNKLTGLDVSGCENLQYLICKNNELTELNVSDCGKLLQFHCHFNKLTSLDISECTNLGLFQCGNNQLTELDISNCENITRLFCNSNQISELDFSNIKNLNRLDCYENQFTDLDLSAFDNLQWLDCRSNELTNLKVSNSSSLGTIYCQNNRLTFADLPIPGTINTYEYAPQAPIAVGIEVGSGGVIGGHSSEIHLFEEIDLTRQANINGSITDFEWWLHQGFIRPQLIVPALADNGLFAFDEAVMNEVVYCYMTNELFPQLTLETTRIKVIEPLFLITDHPVDATVAVGDSASFTVDVQVIDSESEGALYYQWQCSIDNGSSWQDIDGEKENIYTLTDVNYNENGNMYRCQVTFSLEDEGSGVVDVLDLMYSKAASLKVVALPRITGQPEDIRVGLGGSAIFTVLAEADDSEEGGQLSYQWEYSEDGGDNWHEISGARENVYKISEVSAEQDGNQFRCTIINTKDEVSSQALVSDPALLTVTIYEIEFIKPTEANDINNPVNINSGSLIIAKISGDIESIDRLTISIDDGEEENLSSAETVYYLIPNNLTNGEHSLKITLLDNNGATYEKTLNFYWETYRRGFGFGRFDFGDD